MRLLRLLIVCLTVWTAAAQTNAPAVGTDPNQLRDAVNWASGMRGRFRQMHDKVVRTYGLAALGAAVCRLDQPTGSGILAEAIRGLNESPGNFMDARSPVLPVASFTSLYKYVTAAATKCDSSLPQASQAVKERVAMERTSANSFLGSAESAQLHLGPVLINHERIAQLVDGALEVGDPLVLDYAMLTRILIRLRDPAPDLADDVFPRAAKSVLTAIIPNPNNMLELGTYLFVDPRYAQEAEPNLKRTTYTVGATSFPNLKETRPSADSDAVLAFLDSSQMLLDKADSIALDPAAAYALAYQLLPKARDLAAPDFDGLQKDLAAIRQQYPSQAGSVEVQLNAEPPVDPDAEIGRRDFRTVGRVRAAIAAGHFANARDLLAGASSLSVKEQVGPLIDFTEAVQAIRGKDIERAMQLANHLPAGVKRSLLYAGISAFGNDRTVTNMELGMGLKDAEQFSYELRMCVLPAMAASAALTDGDLALMIAGGAVEADNNASFSPRKTKVELKSTSAFDGLRVLFSAGGISEAIDTQEGRQTFSLKVPGVTVFSLRSFLMVARTLDYMRLDSVVMGLRNENRLAKALVALVEMRLGEVKLVAERVERVGEGK